MLKHQFSQVEGDLDFKNMSNPVPIPIKRTPRKEMVVMKGKNEESEKLERRSIASSNNKNEGEKQKKKEKIMKKKEKRKN